MANVITTTAPEEVREALDDYATVFDMYANDQLAMIQRLHFARDRKAAHIRAQVYNSLAIELRETVIKKPDNNAA